MIKKFTLLLALAVSFFFTSNTLFAENTAEDTDEKIEEIIALNDAPAGVVFEIVTGSSNSLQWALPETKNYIKRLRKKFPTLEVAIVTHGYEQFALKTTNNNKFKKVHSLTQQLVQKNNVQLHVCGTYAERKNVSEEEFPNYVDVTAEGPATINDYISVGYILIKI